MVYGLKWVHLPLGSQYQFKEGSGFLRAELLLKFGQSNSFFGYLDPPGLGSLNSGPL